MSETFLWRDKCRKLLIDPTKMRVRAENRCGSSANHIWQTHAAWMGAARTLLRNLICSVPRDEISISPQLSLRLFIFICSIWCASPCSGGGCGASLIWLLRMHFLVAQVAAINCTECSFVRVLSVRLQKHKTSVGLDQGAGAFQRVVKKGVVLVQNARNANSISSFECGA